MSVIGVLSASIAGAVLGVLFGVWAGVKLAQYVDRREGW